MTFAIQVETCSKFSLEHSRNRQPLTVYFFAKRDHGKNTHNKRFS